MKELMGGGRGLIVKGTKVNKQNCYKVTQNSSVDL